MTSVQWARSDAREAKRMDRASDRTGGADLEAYNQMLAANAAKRAAAENARDAELARRAAIAEREYETGPDEEA
jgi:hypothetical protein